MASFSGGSAYAMVEQVTEGFVLITDKALRRYTRADLDRLVLELDKKMRSLRSDQPSLDDIDALRMRNRRLQRLGQARRMLEAARMRFRRR